MIAAAISVGQGIVLALSLYQSLVTLAGYVAGGRRQQRPGSTPWHPRFALVVCARDEAGIIGQAVRNLLEQEYPDELRDVYVVAHNCSDRTAEIAAAAGARVVVASSAEPGKAHAIRAALGVIGDGYDLVGIFDADARAHPGLLSAVASLGPEVICCQAETVPIEDPEWIAEGYGFGRKARNLFWWRPREALGLGTTISGCGWFIRPDVLREALPQVRTLTEDLELTAWLALRGIPVWYVSSGQVAVGEARDLRSSLRQRLRWVRGHLLVVGGYWPALVRRAVSGDARALDLAIYLLTPTRMLTRLGATLVALWSVAGLAVRLPWWVSLPVALAEWGIPGVIAVRERLIGLNRRGLALAARHGVLSLLWFPIGAWALVTARVQAWETIRRPGVSEVYVEGQSSR